MFYRGVSNKNGQNLAFYPKFLVEMMGLEPTAYALRTHRSTS